MKKILLLLCLNFIAVWSLMATHNRAGEITYVQIGPSTIRATVTTYTKTSSVAADRDSLEIQWGDGSSTMVARSVEIPLPNDIKLNQYIAEHTYPGPAVYVVSMFDPNRNDGILNVNNGLSDQVQFYLQTEVTFLNATFQGPNSSPILLQRPIDIGFIGQPFQHTLNAWDPDGDSIAYEMITPLQGFNTPVPNYQLVTAISPGPNNNLTFDTQTGLITWTSPQRAGEYNIAVLVKSYRNGVYLGGIVRDMQIIILNSQNRPPVIQAPDELCVVAGEFIEISIGASDPDVNDKVYLSATGGPFNVANSPATFVQFSPIPANPTSGRFRWQTTCDHPIQQFYQVAIKAQDDALDTTGLAAFHIIRIRVLAPPPENLTATVSSGQVTICWDAPYPCEGSDRFRGFSIWRKVGCDNIPVDTCESGLDGLGYTRLTLENIFPDGSSGQYCYVDNNIQRGTIYAYRVLAHVGPLSTGGFEYNVVPSIPSEELCVQTARDIPLMINADVTATDNANGSIFVRWTKPIADDLDTLQNLGPYVYKLYRSNGLTGASTLINQSVAANFWQAIDTSFTDTGLNTVAGPYNYMVEFLVENTVSIGETQTASSIFLTVNPTDQANNLSWDINVPWGNYRYDIYRKDPGSSVFNLIGNSTIRSFTDTGLVNGLSYCYRITSLGDYNTPGVPEPLINNSQEVCAIPRDNVPPCPPTVTVDGCSSADIVTPQDALFNLVSWTNNNACASDAASFRVYYANTAAGPFNPVGFVLRNETYNLEHQPSPFNLSGCYYVTAIDSVDVDPSIINSGGNEGPPSDTICVDNCPLFQALPNVFTPNGDGDNDVFHPFLPYRFIESVQFTVYNRWGELVFSTTEPMLNWDGTDQRSGEDLAEGVYYYTCSVTVRRLEGLITLPEILKGYIELVR
jgi:gliding motility-associated-like protein